MSVHDAVRAAASRAQEDTVSDRGRDRVLGVPPRAGVDTMRR
jgi:hypothetical protein